jgi:hypothetical protein
MILSIVWQTLDVYVHIFTYKDHSVSDCDNSQPALICTYLCTYKKLSAPGRGLSSPDGLDMCIHLSIYDRLHVQCPTGLTRLHLKKTIRKLFSATDSSPSPRSSREARYFCRRHDICIHSRFQCQLRQTRRDLLTTSPFF